MTIADKNNDGYIQLSGTDWLGAPYEGPEIIQENHYYPFGLNMEGAWHAPAEAGRVNKYQYNGKELNGDLGLGWNDYGARWYDASVGRWGQVDPLAELAPDWTPYRFGFDNPILNSDPLGLFESRDEARRYKREHDVKGKVRKQSDGSFAIENRKEHSFIAKDSEFGIVHGALVVDRGVHLRDIGLDGSNELSNPNSESYNRNAVVFTDGADIAYALGSLLGLASPSARVVTASRAATATTEIATTAKTGNIAKIPVGRSGNVINVVSKNSPTTINGTRFTGHALDQMQARGIISPSAVLDVIKNPARVIPGNRPGTTVFIRDNLKVVTNSSGDVMTVISQ